MSNKKIDTPFFQKMVTMSKFISFPEYKNSIINEIRNILSSRIKGNDYKNSPFLYGIPDIESLDGSLDNLELFKKKSESLIIHNEPRISEIRILNAVMNNNTQLLELQMRCVCRLNSSVFNVCLKI